MMITSLSYNDLIEHYQDGILSKEEQKHVENLLDRDEKFAKEFQLYAEVDKAISDVGMMNFEAQLQKIHKGYESKQSSRVIWRVAASVAFVFVVGGLLWLVLPGLVNNNQNLADTYFESYQPLSAFRSGDQPSDLMLAEAFDLYTRKEFGKAANKFKDLLNLNPSNNMARFYLGISLIETNKPADAIPLLQEIILQKDVLFESQAEWYLSLCYLKTNDKVEARKHLTNLVNKSSHYKEMASKLLKDLK